MSDLNKCPRCKQFRWGECSCQEFSVRHVDDKDSWSRPMFALDAERAAEQFADEYDADEHSILRGNSIEVIVQDALGNETRWHVSGEAVPTYYATEVR